MSRLRTLTLIAALALGLARASAQDARIDVRADRVLHRVSRYLTGACLEDVNHEVYGGLYSQMIFGESFQEPAIVAPPKGFTAYGGSWVVSGDVLEAGPGDGPKLMADVVPFSRGEVSVDLRFPDRGPGNAGLIVNLADPGIGADNFVGYEIALDPARQVLVLGRHRHNWEPISETPVAIPVGQWVRLTVRTAPGSVEAAIQGKVVVRYEDRTPPFPAGRVALRPWQRRASYRALRVNGVDVPFVDSGGADRQVSGMWRPVYRGSASGSFTVSTDRPFVGSQCQRLTFTGGEGAVGVENRGLNRWGLHFVAGKPYEGRLWARAAEAVDVLVSLESGDGARIAAERRLRVPPGGWRCVPFVLTPRMTIDGGRFAVRLRAPGSVDLGYAFLQPGAWGRFKGLPVRRDVAQGLIDQGITVLRCGGSMINAAGYRWKKMIGPRDLRPPYTGTWYPYSTNGWGIPDFLSFCEAAGFLGVPDFNIDETPQDMADFIQYANGPARTPWGARRAADGHPRPYGVKLVELGNEQAVDAAYYRKFRALAEAIWAADPNVILVVGDFAYQPIADPYHLTGAASGITSLAAHEQILQLAAQHNREVWFDVHVGTDGPVIDPTLTGALSYIDALGRVAHGARYRVVVFELNAGHHNQGRALGNALAIVAAERDGRLPIVTSANCLQPDGQNDNGWDQGLLFLDPAKVWLQPPGYVTRMVSRNYEPQVVEATVEDPAGQLSAAATLRKDRKRLVLQVVNPSLVARTARIHVTGFAPRQPEARVEELAGPLGSANTAGAPARMQPTQRRWWHGLRGGAATYVFPPYSFTVLRLE